MSNFIGNVQTRLKVSSSTCLLFTFRLLSGLFVGLTLSLIGQEIIDYGMISFILVITVVTAAIMRISKKWNWWGLLIFDLICVLIGLILRMYILIAPGAG